MTTLVMVPASADSEHNGQAALTRTTMKYGNLTLGQLEAGINKIGGEEAFMQLLRGELIVSKPDRLWTERDGVIYFSVTSNGMNGPQWVEHLQKKGFRVSDYAKSVLHLQDFKPTNGIVTQIAVLKGMLWNDKDRLTKNIRAMADERKLEKPNAEVACLIRDMFSDEELGAMGFYWIVALHEPIKDSGGDPSLLGADRDGDGRWLRATYDGPGDRWNPGGGFAFAVSQVSTVS